VEAYRLLTLVRAVPATSEAVDPWRMLQKRVADLHTVTNSPGEDVANRRSRRSTTHAPKKGWAQSRGYPFRSSCPTCGLAIANSPGENVPTKDCVRLPFQGLTAPTNGCDRRDGQPHTILYNSPMPSIVEVELDAMRVHEAEISISAELGPVRADGTDISA